MKKKSKQKTKKFLSFKFADAVNLMLIAFEIICCCFDLHNKDRKNGKKLMLSIFKPRGRKNSWKWKLMDAREQKNLKSGEGIADKMKRKES